jgi:hypothetical protein
LKRASWTQRGITSHHRQLRRERDLDLAERETALCTLNGSADAIGNVNPVSLDIKSSGFEPRHVQQIGDKAGQAARFLFNGGQEIGLILFRYPVAKLAQARDGTKD